MADFDNNTSVIDSRDVIERIEELHGIATDESAEANDRTEANNELAVLQALQDEAEGYCPDWKYGAQLIREDYFPTYCEDLVQDIGDLPRDMPSYLVVDWEATARNLKVDYTEVDFDGVTYLVR